jgi:superfamily I DNA and/or RNA helicase
MTSPDTEWLDSLAALWRRERQAHHERFVAETGERPLAERVRAGIALQRLLLDEIDATAGGHVLLWLQPRRPAELGYLRLTPGDPVRLWREPRAPGASAILARRGSHRIAVVLEGELPESFSEGELHLDRDEQQTTFDRGDQALARLRRAPSSSALGFLRATLAGSREPRWSAAPPPLTPRDPALNDGQREIAAWALAARDLALIHGPPGTGKTRTLIEVIRQLAARGDRVLATAASNTAVDNLAERLGAAGVDVVRLGHPARVSAAVEEHTLDARLRRHRDLALSRRLLDEASALQRSAETRRARGTLDGAGLRAALQEAASLRREARQHMRQLQEAIVRHTTVLCATCAGADAALLDDIAFDWVVLDEATQAVDPVALVALSRAPRAVLAGDPHQLPPTVLDPEAARAGLATTFFERLMARFPGAARMLEEQYRMHAAIMRFPSHSKYGGRLHAAPVAATHTMEQLGVAPDPLRPGPVHFIDSAGKGWAEERADAGRDPSLSNPGQAARVAAEVRRLLGRGLAAAQISVIATYRAQVGLLSELLAEEVRAGLEIATVDGFQGRENEAVVVDLVRSNERGDIGFLADTRRMNVALTRARRLLLVVGDSATIGEHPYYVTFLAAMEEGGHWLSAWADDAPPFL